ncbi:hypothetical protein ABPG74_001096 [Tetrahymena malaccensis]
MGKLQDFNHKIQDIIKQPFTERRMQENIETDEQIELQIALKQILEYEHMLLNCSQNFEMIKEAFKEEFEKVEAQVEEQIQEKERELQSYITRCEQLQEANNELSQKNVSIVSNLEQLEEELNRQKEQQRKLELQIYQLNESHNENTVIQNYNYHFRGESLCLSQFLKVQIRERQATVQQLQEENQQQSQQQQRILHKQKTEIVDLQEKYDDILRQMEETQKDYAESLKEIDQLKNKNSHLKEMNEHLKDEIVKILEEKELLFSSDNLDKDQNAYNSMQNGEDGNEAQTLSIPKTAQKEQNQNGSILDSFKNQFSTIYGDLVSDFNKEKHPKSSRLQHFHINTNQVNHDVSKFQSAESNRSHIFNIGNQLSQIKKEESFFEGFNPNTQRSTDSQMSFNIVQNFLRDNNTNQENNNDGELFEKVNLSQKNSKSSQLSIRSSFESPRIQQIIAPQQSQNKSQSSIPSQQEYMDNNLKSRNLNDLDTQEQDQIHQNEIKLDKYSAKLHKGHQRYLSAIPTSKSNSFNESEDENGNIEKIKNHSILNNNILESQAAKVTKHDVETQTKIDQENNKTNIQIQTNQINVYNSETQTVNILSSCKEVQTEKEELKNEVNSQTQEEQKKEQQNKNKTNESENNCQKCVYAQDPYYVFYILICQTAKMNSKYKDDVIDFDIKQFYQEIKEIIPINQWYQWASNKLIELRNQFMKK